MSTIAIFDGPDMFDPLIFDTRIKSFFVTIADEGGNVSDTLSRLVKYRRELLEGQGIMFDGPDMFDPLIFDTEGNIGAITDSLTATRGAKIALVEAAIIVSDVLTRLHGATANLIENVASSDSLTRVAKYFRTITEAGGGMFDGAIFDSAIFDIQFGTISISDTVAATRGAVVTISENTIISDTLTRMQKSFRIIAENTIVSDVLTRIQKSFRIFTENNTISDDLQRTLRAFRTFTEPSIVISDAIASVRGAKVTLLENTIVSDVLTRLTKQFRSFTEINTVSDILTAFKVVGRRSKQARAWINKRTTKAFIFKRNTNANANKRGTSARV